MQFIYQFIYEDNGNVTLSIPEETRRGVREKCGIED